MDQYDARARLKALAPLVFEASVPQNATGTAREQHLHRTLDVVPAGRGISYLRTQYSAGLTVMMAIVGVVLLIACTNMANLLLARATLRQREIAVRLAIGASRARLVRQLLTESLLLSVLGGLAGSLFAAWTSPLLVSFISRSDSKVFLDLSLDARALAFTAGIAVFSGLLFGLVPALRGSSLQPNLALKNGSRSVGGGLQFGLGKGLVVSQVALSLVLLIGSTLLVKTFRNLRSLDTGFRHDNVLLATMDFSAQRLPRERRAALRDEVMERVRALPGVQHAAQSNAVPIGGGYIMNSVFVEGFSKEAASDSQAYYNDVSPDYFATLSTPIIAGREFDARDRSGAPRTAIVNEGFARKYFGGQNPVGRLFYVQDKREGEPAQIIGLVKDAKYANLRDIAPPTVYLSLLQGLRPPDSINLEVSAIGNPASLIPLVRRAMGEANKNANLQFMTFDTQIGDSLLQERLLATMSGFFGVVAVLLAAIGLYGVMSFMVARRRAEIGIRMALGAQQSSVTGLILREVATLVSAGLTIGLPLTLASTRVLGKMLFGVTPSDPATITASMALLAAVATLAGYLPARRAARVDPMTAIRES